MAPRPDRRDVHIHLYLNDPDEKRAYDFLQKRKSQNGRWIAQAINAYADAQRRPGTRAKQAPGQGPDAVAAALGRIQSQLAGLSQRLGEIEQLVREQPRPAPAPAVPPVGSLPAAPVQESPSYKSGAGFSEEDLKAEAARIPQNVFANFQAFTGRQNGRAAGAAKKTTDDR